MADVVSLDQILGGWIDILHSRFKIEIAHDRQAAFFKAINQLGSRIGETEESFLYRAANRLLTQHDWSEIIHLATNHETRFYRYKAIIDLVSKYSSEFARPRVLSVGCSTGEEPYTFAVEMSEKGFSNFQVHGIDISAPCISHARAGVYKQNPAIPARYVSHNASGQMKFYDWFKDFVSFEEHNVLSDQPIDFPKPTTIVTQNMLIYYRRESRIRILENLALMLPKGGYLITGPAEAEEAHWKPSYLERLSIASASVFRKSE